MTIDDYIDTYKSYANDYEKGREDQKEEMIPLLKAIKFVLDDYATRLADYSKAIDEQLKEHQIE